MTRQRVRRLAWRKARVGRAIALIATTALLAAACGSGATGTAGTAKAPATATSSAMVPATSPSSTEATQVDLQVYAAASLRPVLAALTAGYQAAQPGATFSVSIDSSAALEAKIEQGAPADVFLAADMTNPRTLLDRGFASGTVTAFAGNHLALIVPVGNPANIHSPADLARAGVRVIACAEGVPVQRYAAQLLDNLVAAAGYPAGFPDAYRANVVSAEDNVGAIVAKVALGEGDAGIVYVTDARASNAVEAIEIPTEANPPATYGGVVVGASGAPEAAAAFLAWVAGPDGQAILSSFGFVPVS